MAPRPPRTVAERDDRRGWWRDFIAEAPDEFSSSIAIWSIPPAPPYPAELHGHPVVIPAGVYIGDPEEGARYIGVRTSRLAYARPPAIGKVGDMSHFRRALPQLDRSVFLTDGGMETWLVFLEGVALPCFVAFPLLSDPSGRERMTRCMTPFLKTAADRGVGFMLGSPRWRANSDGGAQLGYSPTALRQVNHEAVTWAKSIRDAADPTPTSTVIEGLVGPRGDGYKADLQMASADAKAYHPPQIETFAESGADMVTALTMTYADEAIGIVRIAQSSSMPIAISYKSTDAFPPARHWRRRSKASGEQPITDQPTT